MRAKPFSRPTLIAAVVQGVENNVGPLDHDPSQQVALFRDAKSRVGVDVAIQPKAKNELIETCLRVLFQHLDGRSQKSGDKLVDQRIP